MSEIYAQVWSFLPEAIRDQARQRFTNGKTAPGPGDRFSYQWVREMPPAGYCGPLPVGQLIRRVKTNSR